MNEILSIIDATFKDNLNQLTLHRMPGAIPFAGKFRLIDFALSNMRNSNITNVAIFPYGNYRSLQDHVGSGKRYDLDRRKDGLFILPPKNLYILPGQMITFQRMYEHIEYFTRSNQEYALITAANIVWNIDFNDLLHYHKESNADITEVVFQNIRLKTFILKKSLLLEYILGYDTLEYKTILDVVESAPNTLINIYEHKGYTRTITDSFNYLKSNLDILDFNKGKQVFVDGRPVYSKEKTSPPTRYLQNAKIDNSMISAGSVIDGTVINSVIGRDVIIRKGTIIKNSYIMSNSFIEENAHIEYAILDKQTVIKANTLIVGSLRDPYITQKEQIVSTTEKQRILLVASESYPFIKTGGLADVIGSLSRNLGRTNVDVTVIIPYYKKIKDSFKESIKSEFSKTIIFNEKRYKVRIYSYLYKKVKYYFVDNFDFFDNENVYGYDNDVERFAFFNKTVVDLLDDFEQFDLVHIHDWHTSLIPILIDNSPHKGLKTLLTIHNIEYQGIGPKDTIRKLGITNFTFKDEFVNCLEIGINTATKISTVSQTYKEELKYEYYGKNLTYGIIKRERDFYGVLNGISSSWNPEKDNQIHTKYSINTIQEKIHNKRFLQKLSNFEPNDNAFIIGMVTRITEQKGFDLIIQSFRSILQNENIYFVLLGTGDKWYTQELQKLENEFPNNVCLYLGYDATVPNYIYSGSDIFLMPSRFEPCGLGQMIAMKYGTLPLVRSTGGLNDTVERYDSFNDKGNGFVFNNYDSSEMKAQIDFSYNLFANNKLVWNKVMLRAMKEDNSIKKAAFKYKELYKAITENIPKTREFE